MASSFPRTLLLIATALTAVGCQNGAATRAMNPAPAMTGPGMAMLQAQAQAAAAQQMRDAGVAMAEARVQATPDNLDARRTLAQVYLASGRFRSAAQAYDDALGLAPGDGALRLKKALALLGQGNQVAAIGELDRIATLADAGLAYALAGQAQRGVDLLTQAARAPDATPRTRQNLAFAYALAGQWARAKVIAGQDLDPSAVEARMREWAVLASTADPAVQTAGLLSVVPDGGDSGRPIGLAYIPPASRVGQQVAAAAPAEILVAPVTADKPPADRRPEPRIASKAKSDAQPTSSSMVRRTNLSLPAPTGRQWVVQLGAYDRAELIETNWQRLLRRTGDLLDGYSPSRSEKLVGDRRYHRLSIAGFGKRVDAIELCEALQARGRDCFVRRVDAVLPPSTRV
ncbi:MAG: SPOR domain-containing protein [Sphingomonadaceae bacterium]|nr:SPOR domain-containing protein [Sphingomonadaceae bacterium]